MTFKEFFESYNPDDDWPHEDILDNIQSNHEKIQQPYYTPQYMDPDDLYNRGGVFSFTYSNRLVKKGNQYEPEGLEIASPHLEHRYMIHKNNAKYNDKNPILSGRYGVFKNTPILAIWPPGPATRLIKPAIQELFRRNLIHDDALLYIEEYKGKAIDFVKPHMPENLKKEVEQVVNINGRNYRIYELPALLHTLPGASDEAKAINDFICNNHNTYPILKNFLNKAGCIKTPILNKDPEWIRRNKYWPTSEGVKNVLWKKSKTNQKT